jgi:hypothetical protein
MALAQRRPYGIYRWLANAPRWFYRLGLGWLLGYRLVQITHRGRYILPMRLARNKGLAR